MSGEPKKIPRGYRFNQDVEWQKFVYEKYQKVIAKIAFKYCMQDADLREDLKQEAMMALMTIDPKEVKGYVEFTNGEITEKEWKRKLDTYIRQVARNSVLAPLASVSTGNWYSGRKKRRKNPVTGEAEYVATPAMYVSFDSLFAQGNAVQIGTDGTIHMDGALRKYSQRGEDHQGGPGDQSFHDNLER